MSISLVKWTGNKRRQAAQILSHFPAEIANYHEPFLGGGSVLGQLLENDIRVGRYECSDAYAPLIGIWNLVKDDPDRLLVEYARLWSKAGVSGRDLYHQVRRSFNRSGCPIELFYLVRTCRLGHIRINTKGGFTSAFDRSRSGVHPDRLRPIVEAWHRKLGEAEVRFAVRDYREVVSEPGDLLYLDPPYPTSTRYYGRIDFGEFFTWLDSQQGSYLLSLGGCAEGTDDTIAVPDGLYDERLQIEAGDNPFHRLSGRGRTPVSDNLYIRREEGWVAQQVVHMPGAGVSEGLADGDPARSMSEDGQEQAVAGSRRISVRKGRRSVAHQNKSEAIRRVLEAVPEIKATQARVLLAKEGVEISLDLFRVVKRKWKRDRQELLEIEQKYKDYWNPDSVRRRVEERIQRQREEQEHRRRMEEEKARLWEEFRTSMTDDSTNPPSGMAGGVTPWLDDPSQVTDLIGPAKAPIDGPPPVVESNLRPVVEEDDRRPSPPPSVAVRHLTEEEIADLVAKVVHVLDPTEWDEIVADYGDRPKIAKQAIAWHLRELWEEGHQEDQAVALTVTWLRDSKIPTYDEEDEGDFSAYGDEEDGLGEFS